jgi:malonyl-CoA O-methyltransferase
MDQPPLNETPDELPVQAGYAAWAECYDDDGNPLIALEGPAVRASWGSVVGRLALDLGCGTGRHTLALADDGARVVALDLTPEMMTRARAKLAGRAIGWVRHALPGRLPFRAGTFDLVVLGLVAEHIADLAELFRESARVLGGGGRCVVSALHPERTAEGQRARFIDPATGTRHPIVTYHRTVDEYCAAAAAAGLQFVSEQTLIVPASLAQRLPRAGRYVGRALGWVGSWERPGQRGAWIDDFASGA